MSDTDTSLAHKTTIQPDGSLRCEERGSVAAPGDIYAQLRLLDADCKHDHVWCAPPKPPRDFHDGEVVAILREARGYDWFVVLCPWCCEFVRPTDRLQQLCPNPRCNTVLDAPFHLRLKRDPPPIPEVAGAFDRYVGHVCGECQGKHLAAAAGGMDDSELLAHFGCPERIALARAFLTLSFGQAVVDRIPLGRAPA